MLSKTRTPYFSNGPLGEKTQWVAFPLLIITTDKSYSSALAHGKQVCGKLQKLGEDLQSNSIKASLAPIEEQADSRATVEFIQSGKDCVANVFTCLSVRFETEIQMWEKLEAISKYLDAVVELADSYKPHKQVQLEVGVKRGAK